MSVSPWSKLYEVNFAALAALSAPAPGSYTIGGKKWWLKGLSVATPGGLASGAVVPGGGLRIRTNFSISYPAALYSGAAPYLRWFLSLAELGARSDVPVVLQARVRNYDLLRYCLVGFMDSAEDTTGPVSDARADHFSGAGAGWGGPSSEAITYVQFGKRQNAGGTTGAPQPAAIYWSESGGSAPAQDQMLLSVFRISPSVVYCAASPWTGVFPNPNTVQVPDSSSGTHGYAFRPGAGAASNLGIYFSPQDQSGGSTNDFDLQALCVWQQVGADLPPPPAPELPPSIGPLSVTPKLLTFRDTVRAISPPWLQNGNAEKVLYSIGVVADAVGDAAVAAVKARFPGAITFETLPLIGRERGIRRGRLEPDETFAKRLSRWRQDHRRRGGPYALLEQLYAFYAPLNFPVELRYASGRSFVLATDGTITRRDVTWTPPGGAARWARWWLIYTWPSAVDVPRWGDGGRYGDGGVWGAKLTGQQVRDLRMVPRDWSSAHAIGRIQLVTPLRTVTISAEG